jgi:hypothetical protein
MTLTQNLVEFLASHPNQSFSTDALLTVAKEKKWNFGMFVFNGYRRVMLETLRAMEYKNRIVSGKNFYRPQWRISPMWMAEVGQRALTKLTSVSYQDGSQRITIYPLTVD